MRSPKEPLDAWEEKLAEELESLPDLQAPATLVPRVMERLRQIPPAAWYQSSWWQWPMGLRVVSIPFAALVLVGLGVLSLMLGDLGLWSKLSGLCTQAGMTVGEVVDVFEAVLGAPTTFWHRYGQPILLGVASLMLATYLTCVAAGTALYRLAWRKAE